MKFDVWALQGYDRADAAAIMRSGVNPLVSVFLAARGYNTVESANDFLNDDTARLHDPFLLADMDKAVKRIHQAVASGETVAIYGDYDVDGMTASCLLASYFRAKGTNYIIYIPDRTDEGYGVNPQALDALREQGASLVITVDSGITALDEAVYAREAGLDLIITDHHECKPELPDALAVVDPKRPESQYPNRSLAGVGVAFKLVCALEHDTDINALLNDYGDFVAIGTIADVMSMHGENRVLVRHGLAALNQKNRPGLRRLMCEIGIERREINSALIGFALSPRLNAAGRMGRTSLTIDLLLTDNDEEAAALTVELCRLNDERRSIESQIFDDALAMIEAGPPPKGPVVLASRNWYQGVMGIVSAKVTDQFLFPAIMISVDENGIGRGSCRSIGRFGMYTALKACSELLINFGGHEMAAGITIAEENIDEFRRRIFAYYRETIKIPSVPTIKLDFEVKKPELLSLDNVAALDCTEPYGSGFLPPFVCFANAELRSVVSVGGGKHSKLRVVKSGKYFDCICFNRPVEQLGVDEGMLVDVAFNPVVNEYRGWRNVQLHVLDIRAHSEFTAWTN